MSLVALVSLLGELYSVLELLTAVGLHWDGFVGAGCIGMVACGWLYWHNVFSLAWLYWDGLMGLVGLRF